jgi:YHS domain-containing protein
MARTTDPVCGMILESEAAVVDARFDGQTFYFCSVECLTRFDGDPLRFAQTTASPEPAPTPLERHEPRYTKSGVFVAPKFGAAGSGGAEYELLPEAHEREGSR